MVDRFHRTISPYGPAIHFVSVGYSLRVSMTYSEKLRRRKLIPAIM